MQERLRVDRSLALLPVDHVYQKQVVAHAANILAGHFAGHSGAVAAAAPVVAAVSKNDALSRVSYTCTLSRCLELKDSEYVSRLGQSKLCP